MAAIESNVEREASNPSTSDDAMHTARALLERQRETLLRRSAEFADDIDDLQTATATLGQGETELATRQTGVELRVALDVASQVMLDDVERALARLDDGTYGICATCGRRIDAERLRALPQVDQCIACQSLEERTHRQR